MTTSPRVWPLVYRMWTGASTARRITRGPPGKPTAPIAASASAGAR
jgi:hypothetical protein